VEVHPRRQLIEHRRQPSRHYGEIHNTEFFEVLLPDAMQKYGLAEDISVDPDGLVHAPTEPGLGAHIDFDLIERNQVGVLS
jgi:L-alanine-DL-glutamate epimerase-like enolase superfamily enzyme